MYLTEGCVYHLKKYLESRDDNNPALFVRGRKPYNRLEGRQYKTCSGNLERKQEYMRIRINLEEHYLRMQVPEVCHYKKSKLMLGTQSRTQQCCT